MTTKIIKYSLWMVLPFMVLLLSACNVAGPSDMIGGVETAETEIIQEVASQDEPVTQPSEISGIIPAFNMVLVPAGTYTVPLGGALYERADIADTVEATGGFYIAETEVTFELWYAVREWAQKNGYNLTSGKEGSKGRVHEAPTEASWQPVTYVDWRNALIWCNALSEMEGKQPLYQSPVGEVLRDWEDHSAIDAAVQVNGNGYRLPTLAEWHLAARYIDGANWTPCDYVSGANAPVQQWDETGAGALCEVSAGYAVYLGSLGVGGATQTEPVKSRKPNALGIYDMSGNVSEWTFTGQSGGRAIPGGNYSSDGHMIQLGRQHGQAVSCGDARVGFRILKAEEIEIHDDERADSLDDISAKEGELEQKIFDDTSDTRIDPATKTQKPPAREDDLLETAKQTEDPSDLKDQTVYIDFLETVDGDDDFKDFMYSMMKAEDTSSQMKSGQTVYLNFEHIQSIREEIARIREQGGFSIIDPNAPKIALIFDNDIYIMNSSNTTSNNMVNLTNGRSGFPYSLIFSPDGSKIVFTAEYSRERSSVRTNIFVMNTDGSNLKLLTLFRQAAGASSHQPCFSPCGTKIAFASGRDIYSVNTDGTGMQNLTNNSSAWDWAPVFSPCGTKIVFNSYAPDPCFGVKTDILIMDADGSNQQNLTNNQSLISDWRPIFSPDGSKIVFNSNRGVSGNVCNTDEIFIMNTDGTGMQNLTNRPDGSDRDPVFSPDGSKIAFSGNGINIMNIDGTGMQKLTNNEPNEYGWIPTDVRPLFFPCGSRIAFVSTRGAAYLDIFSIDLNHPHILQNHTNRDFNESVGWFSIEGQTCTTGCF